MQNDIKIEHSSVSTTELNGGKTRESGEKQPISIECRDGKLGRIEMDDEAGFFNIEVSSDESVGKAEKVPRDFQSEEDFQKQRKEWKPKNEVGEIWKSLKLPIDNPSKPESQAILHAIEELYFFGKYEDAGKVADEVLKGKLLQEDFRKTVSDYRERSRARLKSSGK